MNLGPEVSECRGQIILEQIVRVAMGQPAGIVGQVGQDTIAGDQGGTDPGRTAQGCLIELIRAGEVLVGLRPGRIFR